MVKPKNNTKKKKYQMNKIQLKQLQEILNKKVKNDTEKNFDENIKFTSNEKFQSIEIDELSV